MGEQSERPRYAIGLRIATTAGGLPWLAALLLLRATAAINNNCVQPLLPMMPATYDGEPTNETTNIIQFNQGYVHDPA